MSPALIVVRGRVHAPASTPASDRAAHLDGLEITARIASGYRGPVEITEPLGADGAFALELEWLTHQAPEAPEAEALVARYPKLARQSGIDALREEVCALESRLAEARRRLSQHTARLADFIVSAPGLAGRMEQGSAPEALGQVQIEVRRSGQAGPPLYTGRLDISPIAAPATEGQIYLGVIDPPDIHLPGTPPPDLERLALMGSVAQAAIPEIEEVQGWGYDPRFPVPVRQHPTPVSLIFPEMPVGWQMQYQQLVTLRAFSHRCVRTFLPVEAQPDVLRRSPFGAFDPDKTSVAQLQAEYDAVIERSGRLSLIERDRGLAWFADRALNGLHPCRFQQSEACDSEDTLLVAFTWDDADLDGEHEQPDVRCWFQRTAETVTPTRVEIRFREEGLWRAAEVADRKANGAEFMTAPLVYTPESPAHEWAWALKVFRTGYLLYGEVEDHLGRGHVLTEQYLIAAMRTLHDNPIRQLLMPHLRDVDVINGLGVPLVFGEHGVLSRATGLTPASVGLRLSRALGATDWKGFRPREPVCEGDRFSRAAAEAWAALSEGVRAFTEGHQEEIQAHWAELQAFSDTLIAHCPALHLEAAEQGFHWLDDHERPLPVDAPGRARNQAGEVAALHPLPDGDLDALAQLCTHAIYHATFFHTWTNDAQYTDGGELDYATFAMSRRQPPPSEEADREAWRLEGQPGLMEGVYQLFLAEVLTSTRYGYIVGDEPDNDVTLEIKKALEARGEALAAAGLRLEDLRARVNT